MDPKEATPQQTPANEQTQWVEEGWEEVNTEQQSAKEEKPAAKLEQMHMKEPSMLYFGPKHEADKAIFVNGLSVGLGMGCIATFVVMWITVYFTPQLPADATYENLLSIFIYPLIYLLGIGLITLTAGIVRQYYAAKFR